MKKLSSKGGGKKTVSRSARAKRGEAMRAALGGTDEQLFSEVMRDRILKAEARALTASRKSQTGTLRHVAMSEIERRTWALMKAGHIDIERICDGIAGRDAQEIGRTADWMAQRAAFLSAYADARGASGCGDSGHDRAIRTAQKQLKAIRKTLGYTYP